jgi:sugar lactone lactonase YvrE
MKKTIFIAAIGTLSLFSCSFGQLKLVFESDTVFNRPESVVFDKKNQCLYVSNFHEYIDLSMPYNEDYVSKVSLKGEIIEEKFVKNLSAPTGICLWNDQLYIVERFGVVKFDVNTEKVVTRFLIPNTDFLNDIAVDTSGDVYITDSGRNAIYRIHNSKVKKWLDTTSVSLSNGIIADGDKIIVCANADSSLKSITIKDKKVQTIARFHSGILDGLKKYGNDYFVSHYEGNLYQVHPNGEIIELLNTRNKKIKCADFEFIEELNLFVIPALRNKKIFEYKYLKN